MPNTTVFLLDIINSNSLHGPVRELHQDNGISNQINLYYLECERAFSAGKRLVTDHRYNLKNDIIEADQCINRWCKHGIVDGQAAFTNIAVADDEIVDTTS